MDKKKLFYIKVWPYGVGCGDFTSYAFKTESERDKWMDKSWIVLAEEEGNPVVSFEDYDDMQRAYGNNFRVFKDDDGNLSVCGYRAALEIAKIADVEFF